VTPALEARAISVSFGGVLACDDVDLAVDPGNIVGLTGPNGSGKSTFMNAVTGLVAASGHLEVGGETAPLGRPIVLRRLGVARAFQSPQNWMSLSCLENVVLGSDDRTEVGLAASVFRRPSMRRRERQRWAAATEVLERVGLGPLVDAPASQLTYGQQRLLELSRSVVGRPSVLLLDEPSAGLNDSETAFLGSLLTDLRSEGMALIVIDHKIDFLDSLCDRITVLQLGRVIAEGSPREIWRHRDVIDAYLGIEEEDE
jgi:ABC-type branched-subunit amino acid transport system ATPase component